MIRFESLEQKKESVLKAEKEFVNQDSTRGVFSIGYK
jgi:hypothetical protein